MNEIQAAVWPSLRETRVLVTTSVGTALLKARLRPGHEVHPAALGRLLTGVALWQGQGVHAVLGVDSRAPFYGRCPGLSFVDPAAAEHVTLDVVTLGLSRPRRTIDGLGSFRELQHLLEEVRR